MALSDKLREVLGRERIEQARQYEPIVPKYRHSHEAYQLPMDEKAWLAGFEKMYYTIYERDFVWNDTAKAVVLKFNVAEMKKGVTLIGNPGIGKTSILITIARMLRYTTTPSFDVYNASHLRRCFSKEGDNGIDNAFRHPALIDDIGAEGEAIYYGNRINLSEKLIEGRWNGGHLTHYTSNLTPEQLAEYVGPRSFSRLKGGTDLFVLTGKDMR